MTVWGLALLLGAATPAGAPPEVVVLLPIPEQVSANANIEAWEAVKREIARAKAGLGVSTELQGSKHIFIIGPARERSVDCASDIPCLAEIGRTLGAEYLVAGTTKADAVALVVIKVSARSRLGRASSTQRYATRSFKQKGRSAGQRVVSLLNWYFEQRELDELVEEEEDEDEDEEPVAAIVPPRAEPAARPQVELPDAPSPAAPSPAAPSPAAPSVAQPPPALAPTPPPTLTQEWWFWTMVGAAVVAGSTSAFVLAGGIKGGPSIPSETGTIRGTY